MQKKKNSRQNRICDCDPVLGILSWPVKAHGHKLHQPVVVFRSSKLEEGFFFVVFFVNLKTICVLCLTEMEQNQEENQDKHSEPAKVFDNNKTPPSQLQNKGCLIFSFQNFGLLLSQLSNPLVWMLGLIFPT